jgi:hypothetical protein
MRFAWLLAVSALVGFNLAHSAEIPRELRVGRAGHAFDHVGGISDQAAAAAASGASIIYATGLGGYGYHGLPGEDELSAFCDKVRGYNRQAKEKGIELVLGYVCATSIVKLDSFDAHWSDEFRLRFKTRPAEWRQIDRQGNALPSWYGGDYEPACMNNPDWRAYQRFIVQQQLETGHDGIFFDNPTVHPDGCYCSHCMRRFAAFMASIGGGPDVAGQRNVADIQSMREYAAANPKEFLQFRCTIARDFLADIRSFTRTINREALVTCNNSLNSPDRLYAQCRSHGYNIWELSKVEDFVVVEDMATQPRTEAGRIFEYGPTYKQLQAINHGKPIVAVTLVNDDYHTAPQLVRLAMAEAAANNASYLSWPTWPEEQRAGMVAAIRPQADLLRRNEGLLNEAPFRADVVLLLPFRRWLETDQCRASTLAAALTQANVQYKVISEHDIDLLETGAPHKVLLIESKAVLTPHENAAVARFAANGGRVIAAENTGWLADVLGAVEKPSLVVQGPPTVRAVVHDQPNRTIIHVLNLNVERLSSFQDRVTPATGIKLAVRVPFATVQAVTIDSADETTTTGLLQVTTQQDGAASVVSISVPRLHISAMIVIESGAN